MATSAPSALNFPKTLRHHRPIFFKRHDLAAIRSSSCLVHQWLRPRKIVDVEMHALGHDACYGLFNAVISTGLDLRFEPLLLLAREGDGHGAILSPFPRLPNPLELLLVLDAALDIVPRTLTHADDVVLAHLAHRLGRRAEDHRAVG